MKNTLSRRQFLRLSMLASAGLAACGSNTPAQPSPAPVASPTPTLTLPPAPTAAAPALSFFDAIETLRRAVRASPDHLTARAEALSAAGDAEELVRFVRESLTVYPAGEYEMGSLLTGWRWGTRAALRAGSGTPREIAELLADLLHRAGLQAEVVEALQADPPTAVQILRRPKLTAFAPALDDGTLAAVQRALNLPPPQPIQPADPDGQASAALARPLLAALGERARAPLGFRLNERLRYLPTVRVMLNGQPQLANLWAQDGPAFIPDARNAPLAPPPRAPLVVTVRLEAAHSHAPMERFVLVERAWSAEELVGRQVEVAFVPPARTLNEALTYARSREVRARQMLFTPVLVVRGPGVDVEQTRALSVVGDPFTIAGEVLREQAGRARLDERPLPPAYAPSDTPIIAAAELLVNAAAFPHIVLEVTPRDASGAVIENLAAAHFAIEEDDRPVAALMERWTRPAARVLLLLDDSGSIPADFRNQGAQQLVRALAAQIKTTDPDAQFRVAKIYEGVAEASSTVWTGDLQALADQVGRVSGFGSQLWESLADAARHAPTVIVMITDGKATDATGKPLREPPAAALATVQAGPPAVTVGVGEVDPDMLAQLGQAGRLGAFPVATQEEAIQAILQVLRANPLPPYRFIYRAREGDAAPRVVRLFEQHGLARQPRKAFLAQAAYTPPPPDQRSQPPALSGLFLTVQVGNQTVRRTLGGLFATKDADRPTPEHLAEVRRVLQGRTTLSFEAGAPPLAQQLDDCYTALLSLRPILEARDRTSREEALANALLYAPPADLHAASVPLPGGGDAPLTFETGLRVTLHRILPAQMADNTPAAVRWSDLLPLAGFRTADSDGARAFALTVQRTARLALAEAIAFPNSTLATLRDETLRLARTESDIVTTLKQAGASDDVIRRARDLFAPWLAQRHTLLWAPNKPHTGWAVDAHGAVWGVLSGDGAQTAGGGSGMSASSVLEGAMLLSDLAAVLGLGGFSFAGGVWLLLAATLYKKLEAATALLAQLPTSPDDPPPDTSGADDIADPSDIGCALAQAAAFEALSRVGGAFFGEMFERLVSAVSALDGARSMATGSGFFC